MNQLFKDTPRVAIADLPFSGKQRIQLLGVNVNYIVFEITYQDRRGEEQTGIFQIRKPKEGFHKSYLVAGSLLNVDFTINGETKKGKMVFRNGNSAYPVSFYRTISGASPRDIDNGIRKLKDLSRGTIIKSFEVLGLSTDEAIELAYLLQSPIKYK